MSQYKTGQVHWLRGAIKGPACLAGNFSAHESVFRRHQGVFQGGKVTRYCLITFFFLSYQADWRLSCLCCRMQRQLSVTNSYRSLGEIAEQRFHLKHPGVEPHTRLSALCTQYLHEDSPSVLCVIWLGRDLARHFMKHYEEARLDCNTHTQIAQCWVCVWVCRVQGPRSEI